jgi:nitric oxide dioxygenase
MPNGQTTMRNYSLSDKPDQDWFRISVKREDGPNATTPKGYVSNLLHTSIEVGSELEIAPPCGEFFLDISEQHQRPLVLIAAGVGITPIFSILLAALDAMPERKIIFIHGSLNEDVQAFKTAVDALTEKHPKLQFHYRYSDATKPGVERKGNASTGFIDANLIESMVPSRDADYYFCGPQPFMVSIYHDLLAWGMPPSQVHFEFFGPRQELEKATA